MKIYPSLFAYLNQSPLISDIPQLQASQRPIIVLESEEILSETSCLIPITDRVYEIGFPYLQPTDLQHHNFELQSGLTLDISGKSYILQISDEILDLETIKEEAEIQELENRLGERLDKTTANLIRLFIGMFTDIFSHQKTVNTNIILIELPEKLELVNIEDANLPIIISLDKRYQLRRKLEAISDKLRHQLRRQAESMSVGKIQEMDSYCLRDYVRRPGLTAVEKAGSKQQLMGIQRYQDFNTPENKFLVYFSQILHLNCFQYERSGASQFRETIRKIRLVIDLFKQQRIVKTIQDRSYKFTQPNYVLQQNPIYRSFYEAYLEYLRKKNEKEKLWTFRNALLADSVYIYLTASLLKFQGIDVDANLAINGSLTPDKGCYLNKDQNIIVKVFLKNQVYVFSLKKPPKTMMFDWVLTLEIHNLYSLELKTKKLVFPIWVFWYRPNDDVISQMKIYLHKLSKNHIFGQGIVFYLQNQSQELITEELPFVKLSENFTEQGFSSTVEMMTNLIKKVVDLSV
ncbi:DUF2357 domain-containing protein [Dolichospermum sp. ST_con]|nr:DUF2357 domain-containing protein [Dolichospermum sp. ST_con]MDD1417898.1 DUF2357 domain-containing protein [Dolichospermum sp. ST_sed1]MDD1423845.1 DUF2357 domain-containing protein [Dolichospermum sp. ST_sed9]MDD1429685.1 DUF2357 domain-containing protein [Dolichospermum sp. ST_sed6]MDD1436001.1 DUF2357 domain-containing protein [Dolichospermum sp. ST_sed10]MDD1439284.1 DUF2357 domain-containing protein [Dolichospermum sp. ST_sed3]MDD1445066.1 DUF2357 domain-containing protein [Dolichosp